MSDTAQDRILALLLSEFAQAKSRRPSYSVRAFARKLGVSASLVSAALRGKAPITRRLAEKLLDHCETPKVEKVELLKELSNWQARSKEIPENYYNFQADHFNYVSDWYCLAIHSLAETRGFDSRPAALAKRLGITAAQAQEALDCLGRLGLLIKKGEKWVHSGTPIRTRGKLSDQAFKNGIINGAALLQRALVEGRPMDPNSLTSATIPADPSRIPTARKMVREFIFELSNYLEGGNRTDVFWLNVHLFPVSKADSQ